MTNDHNFYYYSPICKYVIFLLLLLLIFPLCPWILAVFDNVPICSCLCILLRVFLASYICKLISFPQLFLHNFLSHFLSPFLLELQLCMLEGLDLSTGFSFSSSIFSLFFIFDHFYCSVFKFIVQPLPPPVLSWLSKFSISNMCFSVVEFLLSFLFNSFYFSVEISYPLNLMSLKIFLTFFKSLFC